LEQAIMGFSISSVIRGFFPAFSRHHKLPLHQYKAAALIARCGHSEMGGHLERCPCALTERIVWHSCKHRLCPRCANRARNAWLDHEAARLLPCAHHHAIFTFPHELLVLWRYNRALMTDLLFTASARTLIELLADPRYLGAIPGMLLGLHTWSRDFALHPHIHALVSDGGMHDGQWITPRHSHFLPAGAVKALFRGKFLAMLSDLLAGGALKLPPDCSAERLKSLINRLGRVKWHVWLCKRYEHGLGVITYLARYLRGGPLRDSQLVSVDDEHIVTRYQPHDSDHSATLSLTPDVWLQRYLEHAPISGQHSIRHYGLYAPVSGEKRQLARNLVPPQKVRVPRHEAIHYLPPTVICPYCGQPLRFVRLIPPLRGPP
jgi:hypothetical protein